MCILLNSEALQAEVKALTSLWNIFEYTICADGGANRLYDGLKSLAASEESGDTTGANHGERERDLLCTFCPTHIKGDLDSLRPDVEAFYREAKSCVVRDSDQDTNDLQKCLRLVQKLVCPKQQQQQQQQQTANDTDEQSSAATTTVFPSPVVVVVFGAFGGRFDQQIASLHALYEYSAVFDRMVLIGDGNCATLLTPGVDHSIELVSGVEGPGCALLPVGNRCDSVSTSGLKWNLVEQPLALGELISSSNRVVSADGVVSVRTSQPLLWCCGAKLSSVLAI